MSTRLALGLVAALTLSTSACAHSVMVHRPDDAQIDRALTTMWAGEVRRVARDGDWLLVRSYAGAGDAIVALTPGEEVSHAAVYDADRDEVVEAITPVVRAVPLEEFLHRNRYVIVVRPGGMTAADERAALDCARAQLGKRFDLTGLFGFGREDRFYCSELVYWSSGVAARDPDHHVVITPASLVDYGQVIYFSGRRDDAQMLRVGAGYLAAHPATPARTAAR